MSVSLDYSLLFPGSDSPVDTLTALAAGLGQQGSNLDPVSALIDAEHNETADVAQVGKQPATALAITNFTKAVQNATSASQLLQNPDVLKVLLTANGLASQTAYTALARKALMSDPNDSNSLASQLATSNLGWLTIVQTYDFARKGLSKIQAPEAISNLVESFKEAAWRQSLEASTPGLGNALYFRQKASNITSIDQVLGDATMRTVVTTALGIPPEIAYQDLAEQEQAISRRLDVKQFQDPQFVDTFTKRYLLEAGNQSSSQGSISLDALAVQASGLTV